MSDLDSVPARVEVGALETYPLSVDFSPNLIPGDPVLSVAVELVDLSTGQDVTAAAIPAPPTINGQQVLHVLHPSALLVNHQYRMRTTGNFGQNKVLTVRTVIWVRG